jgi:hypothetical protein
MGILGKIKVLPNSLVNAIHKATLISMELSELFMRAEVPIIGVGIVTDFALCVLGRNMVVQAKLSE